MNNTPYVIEYSKNFEKEFSKLPKNAQDTIGKWVHYNLHINNSPIAVGKALQGVHHMLRYRIGDYRIIAQINSKLRRIELLTVGHRKEIYKRYKLKSEYERKQPMKVIKESQYTDTQLYRKAYEAVLDLYKNLKDDDVLDVATNAISFIYKNNLIQKFVQADPKHFGGINNNMEESLKVESAEFHKSGLSRILQHVEGDIPFAIIGSQDKDTKEDRYDELRDEVAKVSRKTPIAFNVLKGNYTYDDGTHGEEPSLLIYKIPKKYALDIAKKLNQETIIWHDKDFFGFLTPDGKEIDTLGRGLTFDKEKAYEYGSKLAKKVGHNQGKDFAFEAVMPITRHSPDPKTGRAIFTTTKYPVFSCRVRGIQK